MSVSLLCLSRCPRSTKSQAGAGQQKARLFYNILQYLVVVILFDWLTKHVTLLFIQHKQSGCIQTKLTGGQQYSDTSP